MCFQFLLRCSSMFVCKLFTWSVERVDAPKAIATELMWSHWDHCILMVANTPGDTPSNNLQTLPYMEFLNKTQLSGNSMGICYFWIMHLCVVTKGNRLFNMAAYLRKSCTHVHAHAYVDLYCPVVFAVRLVLVNSARSSSGCILTVWRAWRKGILSYRILTHNHWAVAMTVRQLCLVGSIKRSLENWSISW